MYNSGNEGCVAKWYIKDIDYKNASGCKCWSEVNFYEYSTYSK